MCELGQLYYYKNKYWPWHWQNEIYTTHKTTLSKLCKFNFKRKKKTRNGETNARSCLNIWRKAEVEEVVIKERKGKKETGVARLTVRWHCRSYGWTISSVSAHTVMIIATVIVVINVWLELYSIPRAKSRAAILIQNLIRKFFDHVENPIFYLSPSLSLSRVKKFQFQILISSWLVFFIFIS